ncbi:hypothetical protein EJ04DRAFT_434414 [Polyplosphaeria fusca]|uniref:BHLH domain-containing protein n=1 Tax=Polyplosphaeria fusca TaxID=682080 RepID=A0A9P4R2T7_9PLEO|nr:hypothetical protein EJ04DRAFT_434414 [Polyplosphaeria fusca]
MALNWNSFLTDETLALPDDLWSEFPQLTTADPTAMPKSSSNRTTGTLPEDSTTFDSLLNPTGAGPIFEDSLFTNNDFFLGDLGVLQPFGNAIGGGDTTTDSSPEPTSCLSSTVPNLYPMETEISSASQTPASFSNASSDQSPQINARPKYNQRSHTYPNPSYESLFPNNVDAGFVEDVTFPDGPTGKPGTANKTTDDTTVKRTKNKPDIISACWTSPLCPNHDQGGSPPNPSTCGGGCAPFLFADEDVLPTPTINPLAREIILEEGVVEIQPRARKRADSDLSPEETGRRFPVKTTPETKPQLKKESPESPESPNLPPADDPKPKGRRRLPHNQVERKYRESLNSQLESLRRVVPSLQQNPRNCDDADIEDLPAASKPSKAVILASATAHIKQMEKEKKQVQDENQILRNRVKALQALVKCEDCSLMQYVMDLKINQPQPISCPPARAA